MCGRYTDDAELSDIRLTFAVEELELFREWHPTYNITPSYGPGFEQLMVVRTPAGRRALRLGRFWMIPPGWHQPLKALPTTFNARAEELAQKPLWKTAFAEHRCLVPATGWREFRAEAGKKQPYHFHFGRQLFAFAGLASSFVTPDGEVVDSFAIITTEPNELAATIHDRMPLVVPPDLYDAWLAPHSEPQRVLEAVRERALRAPLELYPSDPIANNGRYEGPRALDPVPPPAETTGSARTAPAEPVQGELFALPPRKSGST
jgi:putative SOS response-associated peptidase YedK